MLIVDLLLVTVFFLVVHQLHGSPSAKLQFLGLVLKLNSELLPQQQQKLFGFVGCWLILGLLVLILPFSVVTTLVLFKLPTIQSSMSSQSILVLMPPSYDLIANNQLLIFNTRRLNFSLLISSPRLRLEINISFIYSN